LIGQILRSSTQKSLNEIAHEDVQSWTENIREFPENRLNLQFELVR